jgi:hypothetical protein
MARLRQEIIKTEVAQIERAMALRTATAGHQTQTTQMPMPWHGVAAADAGRSKPWPFNADQAMAQQNAEFDEHKLSDSNKVSAACAFCSVSMAMGHLFCLDILEYCSERLITKLKS